LRCGGTRPWSRRARPAATSAGDSRRRFPFRRASLFLTGASGFIGGALLKLLAQGPDRIVVLERNTHAAAAAGDGVTRVRGDLREPAAWQSALDGIDTVIHLAAVTGKAARATYFETNLRATAALLEAAQRAGAARFLFISTIAARYADAHYHYARSKQQAEEAALASALRTTILRPTIVLGPGSPIGARLRSLAALPVLPVPGDGRVRVQPIDVRDVAALIVALLDADRFQGETIEAGGPDVLTMEEMLVRLRARLGRAPGPRVHLPLGPLRAGLAAAERISLALAPVTAGQLAAFGYDSVADPHPFVESRWAAMRGIEHMVGELAAHG
jgi:NADH dehydrogenase